MWDGLSVILREKLHVYLDVINSNFVSLVKACRLLNISVFYKHIDSSLLFMLFKTTSHYGVACKSLPTLKLK